MSTIYIIYTIIYHYLLPLYITIIYHCILPLFNYHCILPLCTIQDWAPKIAKLPYKWFNYGLW